MLYKEYIKVESDFIPVFSSSSDRTEYFNKALTVHVDASIDSKLVEKLFNDAPVGIFFKTRDDFILLMKSRLQKFRQDEKTGKFFATWREVTGTISPADWSNKNEIPILCTFQDCLDEA